MNIKDQLSPFEEKWLSDLSEKMANRPSLQELEQFTEQISKWGSKPCVSMPIIRTACRHAAYAPLLSQLLARADGKVCPISCLTTILNRENDDLPLDQKEQACRVFLPFVSGKDHLNVMEIICSSGFTPLCQEVFENIKPWLDDNLITNFVSLTILREQLFPNQKDTLSVAHQRSHILSVVLKELTRPLENENFLEVVSRFHGSEWYLKSMIPYYSPQASINLLSDLLCNQPSMNLSRFDQNKQPQVVQYLYDQNKDFWLSYTDPQLEVFLSRDGNPVFWKIHDNRRLQQQLNDNVGENIVHKSSPPIKKM